MSPATTATPVIVGISQGAPAPSAVRMVSMAGFTVVAFQGWGAVGRSGDRSVVCDRSGDRCRSGVGLGAGRPGRYRVGATGRCRPVGWVADRGPTGRSWGAATGRGGRCATGATGRGATGRPGRSVDRVGGWG